MKGREKQRKLIQLSLTTKAFWLDEKLFKNIYMQCNVKTFFLVLFRWISVNKSIKIVNSNYQEIFQDFDSDNSNRTVRRRIYEMGLFVPWKNLMYPKLNSEIQMEFAINHMDWTTDVSYLVLWCDKTKIRWWRICKESSWNKTLF